MTRSHADEIAAAHASRGLSPEAIALEREMLARLRGEAELLAVLRLSDPRVAQECLAHAWARKRFYEAERARDDTIAVNRGPRIPTLGDRG